MNGKGPEIIWAFVVLARERSGSRLVGFLPGFESRVHVFQPVVVVGVKVLVNALHELGKLLLADQRLDDPPPGFHRSQRVEGRRDSWR